MSMKNTYRGSLLVSCCFLAGSFLSAYPADAATQTYTVASGTTQTITDAITCLVTCPSPVPGVDSMSITGGGTLYLANPGNSFLTTGYTGINVLGGSTLAIDSDTELGAVTNLIQLGGTNAADNGTIKFLSNVTVATTRGNITLGTGSQYFDTGANTVIISSKLRGAGSLVKIGSGTLILDSTASNYTGGTYVNAGTLQFFDAAQTAAVTVGSAWKTVVASGATVAFGAAGVVTDSNLISGDGNLRVTGTGTLVLSGTDTYTGQTIVDAGATLQIGANGKAGSIAASSSVLDNGTLSFYRSDTTFTFATALLGSGVVRQMGSGTLLLTANSSSFSGTALVSTGILQIGDATHQITFGGSVSNNAKAILSSGTTIGGALLNNAGGTATVGDKVTIGGMTNASGGSVAFGDSDVFSADATNNGTVVVGASGGTSKITFNTNLTNNNSLTVYGGANVLGNVTNTGAVFRFSDAVTVAGTVANNSGGVLSGTSFTAGNGFTNGGSTSLGSLTVTGGGLTNSGTFTTSGNLTVTGPVMNTGTATIGGTTAVTGDITNSGKLTVNNATITGSVTNNGALSVAAQDDVVTITGNYTQGATGTTYVNLSSTGSSLIKVGGNAALDGLLDITVSGVIIAPKEYKIIDAGSLSGQFASSTGKSNGVSYTVKYVGNSVTLSVVADGLHEVAKGSALTLSDVITGTTSVIAYGGGTLTLTNAANDYSGYTIIANKSTLQIDAASELGKTKTIMIGDGQDTGTLVLTNDMVIDSSHAMTLNAGDETIDTGSHAVTIASAISGAGTLVKAGTGTLVLTSPADYSTDLKVAAGSLQFGDGSSVNMSISGDIISNANLVFNSAGTVSVAGAVTGTGVVYQKGTGTLILNATDGFGLNAVVSSGALQLGNGSLSDFAVSSAVSVDKNASVVFKSQGTITLSGVVSGAGDVHQSGSGILVVTGDQTYSGVTYLDGCTLQIGNGGTTGSLASQSIVMGDVHDVVAFNRSDSYTYSGVISGSGGMNVTGGTVILTGANTYTGPTTVYNNISGATLQIGNGGTTGAVASNIAVTGALDVVSFKRSDNTTYAGSVSGLGTLQQNGTGTLTLTGNSSVSNVTVASGGVLALGATGSFINGSVTTSIVTTTTTNNGVTTVSAPKYTLAVAVPDMSKIGTSTDVSTTPKTDPLTGITTITRTQTYVNGASGALVTANGTFDISGVVSPDGGTTVGSLAGTGTVALGKNNLYIYDSTALGSTFSGTITGSGGLTILAGREYLTGENTYTGTTTIGTGATLYIGNSTAGGSIASQSIVNNGSLSINRTSPLTISSVISGVGSVTMGKAGVLILTANNTYTGATTVNVGALQIGDDAHLSSSVAGSVNVFASSSATTGTTTKLISGGAGGVQTIGGSLTLGQPGAYYNNLDGMTSVYAVTVGAAGVSRLNVVGAVALAGDTEVDVVSVGRPAHDGLYPILTGGSITGKFARGSGASDGVVYSVYYPSTSPNEVDLLVASTASGEIYGDLITASEQNIHALNDIAFDKAAFERCDKTRDGKAANCKGWSVWSKAFGGVGDLGAGNGADGFSTRTAGVIAGAGYNIDNVNSFSAAVGYSSNHVSASGTRSGDRANTSGMYFSLGGHTAGLGLALDANMFYGFNTSSIGRIAGSGSAVSSKMASSYTGWTVQFSYPLLKGAVIPFTKVSYARLINGGFAEAGDSLFGLNGKHGSNVTSIFDVGVRASHDFKFDNGMTLQPHILAAFEESGDNTKFEMPQVQMGLGAVGSYDFVAPTPTPDRLLGVGRLGVRAMIDEALSVDFDVNGRVGAKSKQVMFNIGAAYRF